MTEPLKFCKDCAHCIDRDASYSARCRKEFRVDLVSGRVTYAIASLIRGSKRHCGEEGKWWEAATPKPGKRSLWQRFKAHVMHGTNSAGPGAPTQKERGGADWRAGGPR
jgi:hypothetical protein